MANDSTSEQQTAPDGKVLFHYQKSNFFRVVHADGAYGGVTPSGLVQMAFYSERGPIPKMTSMRIGRGEPTPEQVEERLDGIVREVEVSAVMDFNTGMSLYIWLEHKLGVIRQQLGISDADFATMLETARGRSANSDSKDS